MSADMAAALAALLSFLVTALGWFVTASKQNELAIQQGEIQKSVTEHDTRFSYLHQRRGDVMDQVYKKLDIIFLSFGASVKPGRTRIETSAAAQEEEAMRTFLELYEYYYQNRLYLDTDLCEKIEELFRIVIQIDATKGIALSFSQMLVAREPTIDRQYMNLMETARKDITDKLPPIRDLIEKKMRAILGINHETQPQ